MSVMTLRAIALARSTPNSAWKALISGTRTFASICRCSSNVIAIDGSSFPTGSVTLARVPGEGQERPTRFFLFTTIALVVWETLAPGSSDVGTLYERFHNCLSVADEGW